MPMNWSFTMQTRLGSVTRVRAAVGCGDGVEADEAATGAGGGCGAACSGAFDGEVLD